MIKTLIKRSITTAMIFLGVVIIGFVAICNIPKDLFPELALPYIIVYTSYTGAGPSEVESLVTKTLETALASCSDLEEMNSVSSNGTSMIITQFSDNIDMDFAALNVREKIDLVKGYLPSDCSDPMVIKINPDQMGTLTVSINSPRYDLVKLKSFVDDNIVPQLEKINGVAEVGIGGGKEKVIKVVCYPEKLQTYGLSTTTISSLLASENLNLPGGTLLEGEKDITVRTIGEFSSIDDIKNIPISTRSGTIFLRDVAEVEETYKDISSYSFVNGTESITLNITKSSVANTVDVATKVLKRLEELKEEYEGMIEVNVIMNTADYINDSIDNVASSALIGGLLAIIILYIFLRNIYPTLVIATSIPTSLLATFCLMYLTGMTLNMITLGALTIAIGMLVDASIVVLENIDIHRRNGEDSVTAAEVGTKEVITSVIASTLTSVVVFMPFVFTSGTIMQMLHVFAWVIMFALFASMISSLCLVPMLSSKLPDGRKEIKNKFLHKVTKKCEKIVNSITDKYGELLEYALRHKKKTFKIAFGVVLISILTLFFIEFDLIPAGDAGMYSVTVTLPEGTNIDTTLEYGLRVVDIIENLKGTNVTYLSIGGSSIMSSGGSNVATVSVDIGDSGSRRYSTNDIVKLARKSLENIPGCEIQVEESGVGMTSMMGSGVELCLSGDDNDRLHELADEVIRKLEKVNGLSNVEKGYSSQNKEAKIIIDRNRMSLYGLSTGQVAQTLQTAINGIKATTLKYNGNEIDVMISVDDTNTKYVTDLSNIYITSQLTGEQIPITEVGEIVIEKAPSSIVRVNQKRTITITADIGDMSLSKAQSVIDKAIEDIIVPEGYSIFWDGSMEMMMDSFKSLLLAVVIAIVLVYMVMASQFESLFNPFVIMFTIPFAFAGSLIGLFITGTKLDVVAMMGMIVLVGIVVNNGIILIDFINQRREEGMEMYIATVLAGKQRIRPILMTTLTTILGMIPMAFSKAASGLSMSGLAIVVIFGLATSTLLTLFIIPVLYTYLNTKIENRRKKKEMLKMKRGEQE